METVPSTQTRIHVVFAALSAAVLLGLIMVVPNCNQWMLDRQIRGIQLAARADLALLQERMDAFRAKNGFFTTDLAALNLDAPKDLKVLYKFGFVTASSTEVEKATALNGQAVDLDPSRKDLDALKVADPKIAIEYSPTTRLDQVDFAKMGSYCVDCTATRTNFKAIAAANLDQDPALDVWTIDEQGNITHVVDDLGR